MNYYELTEEEDYEIHHPYSFGEKYKGMRDDVHQWLEENYPNKWSWTRPWVGSARKFFIALPSDEDFTLFKMKWL